MISAGSLRLVLAWDGRRTISARVDNSRPLAAHLLVGRRPVEAVALVSTLFSLCGRAQGVAAHAALEAAQGKPPRVGGAGELAVAAEAAQEHLWRILLDWPLLFARTPQRERFARLHRQLATVADDPRAVAAEIDAVVAEAGLGEADGDDPGQVAAAARRAGDLGEMLAEVIVADRQPGGAEAGPLMPIRSAAQWAAAFDGALPSADFCARPTLAGEGVETGALARQAHRAPVAALRRAGLGIAARLAARLAELSELAGRLAGEAAPWPLADAAGLAGGLGVARVETARGLLLHAARVDKGRIAAYAIVAPTEWNFHPAGVFVREAQATHGHDRETVLACARRLALSLDPCVSWDVVVEDAADA